MVHPAKNIFKCFGCGKGGDGIDFVMAHKGLKFNDACNLITEITGMLIDTNQCEFGTVQEIKPDYIPFDDFYQEYKGNLFAFLSNYCDAEELFNRYHVASRSDNWVLFWYVDFHGNIRSGKYMKYTGDGKRDRSADTSWVHKSRDAKGDKYPDFVFSQCFFGEHLLALDVRKPIAIVESEKTALIASIFIEKYIWVACGSKNGLSRSKCEVLANRSVTLFPDLGAYPEWSEKAKEYNFNISDHIEKIATDEQRSKGCDLADFLI